MTIEAMNERLPLAPYGAFLRMRAQHYDGDKLQLVVPWRAEFAGTPGTDIAHGGVLAAVVDAGGAYAIAAELGYPIPTIDLRVDYHRPIVGEAMNVEAKAIRIGRTFASAEVYIYVADKKLAVSGRGLYSVPAPGTSDPA